MVSAEQHVKRRHESPDLGSAAARMMRALSRRAGEGDMQALEELHRLQVVLPDHMTAAIRGLRFKGYSWADIGCCLGITRQAAQQRYGGDR